MLHETKVIEIRDEGTLIVALATRLRGGRETRIGRLLRRVGYSPEYETDLPACVLLTRANGGQSNYDPYEWGDRTWSAAHHWITAHWDDIPDGGLIDVRVCLGETSEPCASEVMP